MNQRVAYFINQYPKVSHSFIRREILALERQGIAIHRIALRGWNDEIVDAQDKVEQTHTQYVLKRGITGLAGVTLRTAISSPRLFTGALLLALRSSRHADRPWPLHLVYLAEACQVLQWLQACGATHIHAHFGTNSAEVVMLVRALGGPPYSFTAHGPEEFDKPLSIGLGEKIRRSAFVVAISSFGRSQLYRWVNQSEWGKIKVVHCGLEPAFYNIPGGPVPDVSRLVCVGRLCEQKGQLLLVEALAVLVSRGIACELVLAGDGEMRPQIESYIQQNSLQAHVRITGWISSDQVRTEILASRALVLPSFAEGLPVVIMEAMALRRPVITTLVAGIPELVRHQENGWLVPAGDVEQLAEAMQSCLRSPIDKLRALGNAAFQRVTERHDVDTEAAKLVTLFATSKGEQSC